MALFRFRQKSTETETPAPAPEKTGLFSRLKAGLVKSRSQLSDKLGNLFLGKKNIDEELLAEIESLLLMADLGTATTEKVINSLTDKVKRKELADPEAVFKALKSQLAELLKPCEEALTIDTNHQPFVILMVGVNGAGKTTTIGKLAQFLKQRGLSVCLAAGDTYRAAAIEQLKIWGERNQIPVIAQHSGSDSASTIYDAMLAAKSRKIDVVIADTAGRLHTQSNLMEELKKIKRVVQKFDPTAPHETMLVIDAGNGQNALRQAQEFNQAVKLSGITLTKLDGTAKGGVIFSIADQLKIPLRFIGVGEKLEDLQVFNAAEFMEALFIKDF